jgi:uncharacterized protein YjcR
VKLTIADVKRIRTLHTQGQSLKQLAHACGVSYEQVRRIVRGERWTKELKKEQDRRTHAAVLNAVDKYKQCVYNQDGKAS